MPLVYIGVGSNIEPEYYIPAAMRRLTAPEVEVIATSRFYWTDPIGRRGQPRYVNGVWKAECALTPRGLKESLRQIEVNLGRVRSADKFAPRPIDLDILLFGDLAVDNGELTIPDPHIHDRTFLASCLLELDPDIQIPGAGRLSALVTEAHGEDYEEHAGVSQTVRAILE